MPRTGAPPDRAAVRVVQAMCVGSGLCTEIAPRVFAFDANGKARAGRMDPADLAKARDAALACPARAIRIRLLRESPD